MIRKYRLFGFTMILCLVSQVAAAQTVSRTSYFVENSTHRHLMNPALAPTRGYLSIPVAGELYVGTESNLQFTNFIYPAVETNGPLITFLHPTVDGADFLEALNGDQFLRTDIRTSILSYGRWMGKSGFLTFDVGTRVNLSLNLPQDFFGFAKVGMSNSEGNTYHFDNLMVNASMIAEGALGYSVNLTDAIRLGVKGKFLAGGAYVKAGLKQFELSMTPDEWSIDGQGQLDVYGKGLSFVKDAEGNITNFKFENPGLGGMGMAFDLGMEWAPIQNFKLSMAVVDFGSIKWKKDNIRTATSTGSASFTGFENYNPNEVGELPIEDQIANLQENLMGLTKFKEQVVTEDFVQKLNPTINAGVELGLMSNRVSFGGLYTTRMLDDGLRYTEYMATINLKPFRWFNLSGSYSFLHGKQETFGFALGFIPGIVNIFLACDYVPYKLSPQYIPLHTATTNIQLGVSIPLSRRPVKKVAEEEEEEEVDPLEEVPESDAIPPQY